MDLTQVFPGLPGLIVCASGLAVTVQVLRDLPLVVPVAVGAVAYLALASRLYRPTGRDAMWFRTTFAR